MDEAVYNIAFFSSSMMLSLALKGSKSREIAVMLPYSVPCTVLVRFHIIVELFNTVTHLRFLLKNMTFIGCSGLIPEFTVYSS